MTKKFQIPVVVDNTIATVGVTSHNTDSAKLVLKSTHPEAGSVLCKLADLTHSPIWKGRKYFMVDVQKADFLDKAGSMIESTIDAIEAYKAALEKERAALALVMFNPEPSPCPECGTTDGTHYLYCGVQGSNDPELN
jgi:hypothetical protein